MEDAFMQKRKITILPVFIILLSIPGAVNFLACRLQIKWLFFLAPFLIFLIAGVMPGRRRKPLWVFMLTLIGYIYPDIYLLRTDSLLHTLVEESYASWLQPLASVMYAFLLLSIECIGMTLLACIKIQHLRRT